MNFKASVTRGRLMPMPETEMGHTIKEVERHYDKYDLKKENLRALTIKFTDGCEMTIVPCYMDDDGNEQSENATLDVEWKTPSNPIPVWYDSTWHRTWCKIIYPDGYTAQFYVPGKHDIPNEEVKE